MNNVTQMAFEGLAKFTDIVKEQLIEHIMCESERCVEEAAGSGGEKVDGQGQQDQNVQNPDQANLNLNNNEQARNSYSFRNQEGAVEMKEFG